MTTPLAPRFDVAAAYPEFVGLRDAVRAGDWSAIELFFAGLPDPDAVNLAVWVVADIAGAERYLEQLAPSPLSRLLLASRYVSRAWEIRSAKRAEYVSREQFDGMHDMLRRAEQILIELTAVRPGDAVAWCKRLTTAMGLELGQGEARRRYDRLARVAPHFYAAQSAMVQQLCPKWSGSWESLHAFAPGSLSPAVVAEAHLEHYLALDKAERLPYLRSPQVADEITRAALKSVLHPNHRPTYGWVKAHGVFAVLTSFAEDTAKAAVHFHALGDLASSYPWESCFGDASAGFNKLRDAALGGRR